MGGHHTKTNLYTATEMDACLRDLARAIVADVESPVLVGIFRRGVPLARRIARHALEIIGREPVVGSIEIQRYTDDLALRREGMKIGPLDVPVDLEGKTVVLVDDVYYTGWTFYRAVGALLSQSSPAEIKTAVLVRRRGEVLPIACHYVGRVVECADRDIIAVRLQDFDGFEGIDLATME